MTFETIVPVAALAQMLESGAAVLVLDCTFDLGDPAGGRAVHAEGHIPGARHFDLERDMSGVPDGGNGRHPLPERAVLAARLREMGLHCGQQVVVYDGNGGHFAARAWWLLRWLGHGPVAVLDGGRTAWIETGLPLEAGEAEEPRPGDFEAGEPRVGAPVNADDILAAIGTDTLKVFDARDAARFAGQPHPLDPVSGHIPGAANRFHRENFDTAGRFLPPGELAEQWIAALAGTAPGAAVMQCGSGVTACSNLLAMELAGLTGARLYPGSWSEWVADPARPVATGI